MSDSYALDFGARKMKRYSAPRCLHARVTVCAETIPNASQRHDVGATQAKTAIAWDAGFSLNCTHAS